MLRSVFTRCGPLGRGMARSLATRAHKVATGDWVQVHYTGKLDDGTQFDSSRERDPLEFVVGDGMVIKGFDEAVTGLEQGGKRTSRIAPASAYGEWTEAMTAKLEKARLPEQLKDVKVGTALQLNNGMRAVVSEIGADFIVLDANHELAGKHLNFDVEVIKVVPKDKMKQALFGAGCFWSVELAFQRAVGVVTTAVGYAQGNTVDPTYEDVCSGATNHNEVVLVTYNEDECTYKDLLKVFFSKHDPTTPNRSGNDVGTQYRSGIYYYSEEQRKIAEEYIKEEQKNWKDKIVTELEAAKPFYRAEEYHQSYLARGGRFGRPQSSKKGCTDPIRCYG